MLRFQALTYTEGIDRTGGPIQNYATGTLTSWKRCQTGSRYPTEPRGSVHPCKLLNNQNMGELNQGTKMILLSDKLWIPNNPQKFANGSKSIIRNNLGLCKSSEIYLI